MKPMLLAGTVFAAFLLAPAAVAQNFPAKPIRMIVPWPAGGTVDGVARVIGPSLSSGLGRPIVVENKAGAGSSNHLNALLLSDRTGIEMTHVPYKGGAPMMIDLVGGQVNVMFVSAPQAIPQVKAGRIKALAVGAARRIPQLPDAPTVAETLPGFAAQSWVGMLVPAGTSMEIVERLNAEVRKALADPEVRGKLEVQGFDVVGSTPAEFLAFARAESEKWAKVIRDYNIRVE